MFKISAALAAVTILMSGSAMAQVLKGGQFFGETQYTALVDSQGQCTALGLTAGAVSSSIATITALNKPWTSVIENTVGPIAGVTPIACTFPTLPAAKSFKANGDGSFTATTGSTPLSETTTCATALGTFTLVSGNGPITFNGQTYMQTNTETLIANPATSLDYGISVTSSYTELQSSGIPICLLSTSALYLNTVK